MKHFFLALSVASVAQRVVGLEFTTITDLAKAPTLTTADVSEYRIPIDGERFAEWERTIDRSGLLEIYLLLYRKACNEWYNIYFGKIIGEYGQREKTLAERIDELDVALEETYMEANKGKASPLWFRNMVTLWMNALFEVLIDTKEDSFYDVNSKLVPAKFKYRVEMLNKDFVQDIKDAAKVEGYPRDRTTADHFRLLFMPPFQGPKYPMFTGGVHMKSKYEEVARYLVNALEVSAEKGEDAHDNEFQFVVSDLDVSLEHKQVMVYVDPNKTTRMRKTLLKLRDKLTKTKTDALVLGWDVRTQMGLFDSIVAGYRNTDSNILKRWDRIKKVIINLGYTLDNLIYYLDAMAEILRVMEVPSLPETEESLMEGGFGDYAREYLDRTAQFRKPSGSGMDYSPISQFGSPKADEDTALPYAISKMKPASSPSDRGSSDPSILQEIQISVDLREQEGTMIPLPLPESFPQESTKLLSTDVSPVGARNNLLLQPDSALSSGGVNVPRRSIFSPDSRFSENI
ncbi:hypothetical protein ABW20_dc0105578 [Dactylellina cionopaga]|nr:hypothetical protein ABW20_dc0105578 [Dactylellina cionopaga]